MSKNKKIASQKTRPNANAWLTGKTREQNAASRKHSAVNDNECIGKRNVHLRMLEASEMKWQEREKHDTRHHKSSVKPSEPRSVPKPTVLLYQKLNADHAGKKCADKKFHPNLVERVLFLVATP